jgi:hypothetical protein
VIDIVALDATTARLNSSSGVPAVDDRTHAGAPRIAEPNMTAVLAANSDGHGGALAGLQ